MRGPSRSVAAWTDWRAVYGAELGGGSIGLADVLGRGVAEVVPRAAGPG
ncbi:MAG: hypothetical protein NTV52_35125 [Acidobacteria bacterium]|nr:hypothetical protein [Acidobacteriota bacterium]